MPRGTAKDATAYDRRQGLTLIPCKTRASRTQPLPRPAKNGAVRFSRMAQIPSGPDLCRDVPAAGPKAVLSSEIVNGLARTGNGQSLRIRSMVRWSLEYPVQKMIGMNLDHVPAVHHQNEIKLHSLVEAHCLCFGARYSDDRVPEALPLQQRRSHELLRPQRSG
jgi:hypothetical protein